MRHTYTQEYRVLLLRGNCHKWMERLLFIGCQIHDCILSHAKKFLNCNHRAKFASNWGSQSGRKVTATVWLSLHLGDQWEGPPRNWGRLQGGCSAVQHGRWPPTGSSKGGRQDLKWPGQHAQTCSAGCSALVCLPVWWRASILKRPPSFWLIKPSSSVRPDGVEEGVGKVMIECFASRLPFPLG